jgi:hypothetical protein
VMNVSPLAEASEVLHRSQHGLVVEYATRSGSVGADQLQVQVQEAASTQISPITRSHPSPGPYPPPLSIEPGSSQCSA